MDTIQCTSSGQNNVSVSSMTHFIMPQASGAKLKSNRFIISYISKTTFLKDLLSSISLKFKRKENTYQYVFVSHFHSNYGLPDSFGLLCPGLP